ncbi:NADH-dependent FMN reductase RutF [Aquabacterium sp. J223]|uniref:NADH-dependent FMN reductase RutF n=1 Tax=Aquabacterium sp. J223 TaxID=2898431 RepID=UPI0021AD9EEB|nr:pyrimidine utilization flavin reductase protein F [Aquabacterium sp. J223]UUX94430.1 pyrimidine utilization flavin reductase protein F [Aquabacterium sp. J223]
MTAVADPLPAVSAADFRNAMATLGSAVHVITTDGPGGRAGFTASAVCSVTDSPPMLLVCLNRSASVHATFAANDVLCVNTLAAGQEALSALFGGKTPMAQRFDAARWLTLASGAPVLHDALAAFDCRITSRCSVGTHDVLYCEVLDVRQRPGADGLVYFGRRYHALSAP